tara:strand:- start:1813 stop:2178 length:366 start_codon:yes stop_codon:yes gene_type:complete
MSLLTSIQTKISKIFTRLGSTITRTPFGSQTLDKWGDATKTYDANENITGVPYNYLSVEEDYQPFGDLEDGEIILAFQHGQSLNKRDTITYDSKTFLIRDIHKTPIQDGFVLKLARLTEQL